MQSFASYRYLYDVLRDTVPQRYEQYHVIVNGGVDESTTINTDTWSNNLSSSVTPTPPNCYNARISIAVHSGVLACCTSAAYYYDEAGVQCLQGPPPPREPITICDDGSGSGQCSPIVINLESGAYELAGMDDPVEFDIDADGSPDRITWTGRNTAVAFLALDRNGNQRIDDGSELFGDSTLLRSGIRAANGFRALKDFDTNEDGVVNALDEQWSSLLLWTDANHDGVSQASELASVGSSAVTVLDTRYHWSARRDSSGNLFQYQGSASIDRGWRAIYDVYFRSVP